MQAWQVLTAILQFRGEACLKLESTHRKWRQEGREKPDPEDLIWAPELTPNLSLNWSVMGANKFLSDLIQPVLDLDSLLVTKGARDCACTCAHAHTRRLTKGSSAPP